MDARKIDEAIRNSSDSDLIKRVYRMPGNGWGHLGLQPQNDKANTP